MQNPDTPILGPDMIVIRLIESRTGRASQIIAASVSLAGSSPSIASSTPAVVFLTEPDHACRVANRARVGRSPHP